MNLQQLEYIIALDIHRNHVKAAEHCHVTQPTLSMMVKKLEDELDVKIFQKTQPLKPTPSGEIIISRARQILQEVKNEQEEGWTWQSLDKGGVLTIKQSLGTEVEIIK